MTTRNIRRIGVPTIGAILSAAVLSGMISRSITEEIKPLDELHQPSSLPPGHSSQDENIEAYGAQLESIRQQMRQQMEIAPGVEAETDAYYTRINDLLSFNFAQSTLDGLLEYMGYSQGDGGGGGTFSGLLAKDLESLPSFALLPRTDPEFDELKARVSDPDAFAAQFDLSDFRDNKVLVSRFFAPKIATYYDQSNPFRPQEPNTIVAGWRKLVRLTSRRGSAADTAGIQHMYLLFNVKQADANADPFEGNESKANQVILVPHDQDAQDSAYFVVYGGQSEGYPVGKFLPADFDLPGHVGVNVPDSKYFVPRSCAQCHGHSGGGLQGRPVNDDGQAVDDFSVGNFRFAKPNYLDTDQWYDWASYDFAGTVAGLHDVVFDGGKDHGSTDYRRAMDVFEAINLTIRDQTFAAEKVEGTKTFQTLAAEKWLAIHEDNIHPVSFPNRSIGNLSWDPDNENEMKLLRLLNNHCFRCHSSLIYNVFDKEQVQAYEQGNLLTQFLSLKLNDPDNNPLPGYKMPQGRVLRIEERDEMLRLLNVVFPEN